MNTLPQKIDFAFRIVVLVFAMTIGLMFVVVGARNALAANVKSMVTITGDVFTVGDIFNGLSDEKASTVLGPAPLPGKDLVLNASTLMRVAVALELPWRPQTNAETVTLRRAATIVTTDDIRAAIVDGLNEKGLDGKFDLTFVNMAHPQIILPADLENSIEVGDLDYNPQKNIYSATLVAPSADNPARTLTVTGKVERLADVPVLRSSLKKGDIIGTTDIDTIEVKVSDLQNGIILNKDDMVGMTPRRMALAGQPLRDNDLERPELVARGDTITIEYDVGMMTLTAKGKALQSGARGDLVRVVNLSSNQSVEAFVKGGNLVTVAPQ